MADPTEPRALSAALAGPAFATKGGSRAMHAATRHVERWAPEASADRVRPLRNLGFVDRLVAPWIDAAQRSASLRLFSMYRSSGMPERPTTQTSWLFPRPWYQDELDWMTAARQASFDGATTGVAPTLLTTRGTFVAPSASTTVMPSALHEYVAPSLSVAMPMQIAKQIAPVASANAYSPLVPLAAAHAAQVMQRAMAPLAANPAAAARMSPGLRAVLATMLERTAMTATSAEPTRLANLAPELVTPPAPRAPIAAPVAATSSVEATESFATTAAELGAQRVQLVELQRAAQIVAQRELAARSPAALPASTSMPTATATPTSMPSVATPAATRDELEARIAQRVAEREQEQQQVARRVIVERAERAAVAQRDQRLHDAARESAARDARAAFAATVEPTVASAVAAPTSASAPAPQLPRELVQAIAALSPSIASTVATSLATQPERAVQTITELTEALRTAELIARTTAAGGAFESTRGPRLTMPAGLGGLVSTVEHSLPAASPMAAARTFAPVMPAAIAPGAAPATSRRVPTLAWHAPMSAAPMALAAASAAKPAALQHVAWADRWLARFSGARTESLDVLAASSSSQPELWLQALASAAPESVFVAPRETAPAIASQPVAAPAEVPITRYDDNAETPDDVFASIAAAARNVRVSSRAAAAPAAAAPSLAEPTTGVARDTFADVVAHSAPAAPDAGLSAQLASSPFAPALRHVVPLAAAPTFDVRALLGSNLVATFLAGLIAPSSRQIAVTGMTSMTSMTGMAGEADQVAAPGETVRDAIAWDPAYVAPTPERERAVDLEPLTTLRSTLLATTLAVDLDAATSAPTSTARTMAQAMALPFLGEQAAVGDAVGLARTGGVATPGTSYAAPGMIADRAYTWSIAQERSASDLAFDFVTPELVLAARVYGLGPAEAAQAARLAIAGPGALAAMAGTVDRTFIQALAIEADRRDRVQAVTAYPREARDATAAAPDVAAAAPLSTVATAPTSAFGVDRRPPRGAFMWPSATVAALGLTAATPDGEQSISVAALELLAAQTVAELGTYAALGAARPEVASTSTATSAQTDDATTTSAAAPASLAAPAASTPAVVEASDTDVLAAAVAMVPTTRRAKLEAMYHALGQSTVARSWSPAARAARALALAGRGDEHVTAYERASIAWDVLPVVAPSLIGDTRDVRIDELAPNANRSTGAAAQRAAFALPDYVESRPGLAGLSARAGEALGSYVAPAAAPTLPVEGSSSSGRSRDGAVLRAPTAAPELVRPGRSGGRFGGNEVEIPSWFEAAARRMFDERSSGGPASELSLAELTLITAAPTSQIAASTRTMPGAAPSNPSPSSQAEAATGQTAIDIEKVANDVYRQVLVLMDAARFRNGEPYL